MTTCANCGEGNLPTNEPTPDTIGKLMLWLNSHGYAVAIFTPDECANVGDMDELESRMIAAGNNYIAEQE